ncbi:tyrosine-type recombinase/integrase [Lysinibacillus xylanilyticus]|uniref:tyrosine-type recombinase/integrase n=1 Tax=Lysinibacillus xylanilyticus TaxID=582475 RepID=UPI003D078118
MKMDKCIKLFNHENKQLSIGTLKEYNKDITTLEAFLQDKYTEYFDIRQVKEQNLNDYLNMLSTEKGYKPSSRNRQMNTLRSFFKFCKKKCIIETNPAEYLQRLEEPPRQAVFLTSKEVGDLINAINHPLIKLVVLTLFYTGLRIRECLNLELTDVDFQQNTITVRHGKGDKRRVIPLHSELKIYLQNYIQNWRIKGKTEQLFFTERTNSLSNVYVNKVLKETVEKLKWDKRVTCHVLRHSFASALVQNNVNIVAVQQLLGHANLKTTSSYTHIHQQTVDEGIETLTIF